MDLEEYINSLIELGKKNNGYVLTKDIIPFCSIDSDQFDIIENRLLENNIEILVEIKEDELVEEVNLDNVEEVNINDFDTLPAIDVGDLVKMYLKEIGNIPLLTIEEEQKITKLIDDGKKARAKIALINSNDQNIVSSEEYILLENTVKRANEAKDKLVQSNLRLVVSIAKKFTNRGLPFMDLIQEGVMGLIKAADKYEFDFGYKFSTYATWWIRQSIARGIDEQGRIIRVPVHQLEAIKRLVKVEHQLTQELSRAPTIDELALKLNITPKKVQDLKHIALEPVSLEAPVGEEDESSIGDFISDDEMLSPYEFTEKLKLHEELEQVLHTLTPREEQVLRLRFGLDDGRPRTLEEVGKEFNVTRERIRQIEAKAIRKLKHPSRSGKLKDFVDNK